MQKLLIICLAAFVGAASAAPFSEVNDEASQLAMFEVDEVETKALGQEKAIFGDFCLRARDDVKQYMRSSVNSNIARIFQLMVETAAQVSEAIGQANHAAIEQGTAKINEDARQIKSAVGGVASATVVTGRAQIMDVIQRLKEQVTMENLKEAASDVCLNIAMKLKPDMEKKLAAYKKEILGTPEGKQYAELFAKTRFDNLGCVTTSRLSKVATGCNMVRTLAPSLTEFFGH